MEVSDFVEKPLLEKIQDLLERKPEICDVAFCVGKKKKIVKALKVILKASSSFLEKEFEEKWEVAVIKEGDGIPLPDFDPKAFKLFVKLTTLDTWSLEILKELNLPLNQILSLLLICRRFEMRMAVVKLEKLATIFLQSIGEDFLQLSQTNLKSVLGSDNIKIMELDAFYAAIRWADFQCQQMKVEPTEENIRKVLGDCLFEIRFPLMTCTEFTEARESKDILTPTETSGIYRFIGLTPNKKLKFDSKKLPFKTTPRNKVQTLESKQNSETDNSETIIPPAISTLPLTRELESTTNPPIVCDDSRKENLQMASKSSTSSSTTPAFALGIDFGTTFCRVAVLRHPTEKPEVLPSSYSTNTTPSYVAYNADSDEGSDDDNGVVYLGETAKQDAYNNPEKYVFNIKRLIGCSFYNPNIQKYEQLWPFHLVNMTGNVGVQIGYENKLPQEIASEVLRNIKKTSENFLGSPINCAVVTIPVHYSEIQKSLTKWACHAAGFKNIRFIAEPVAAAVAYGIKSSLQSHEAKTCLIYDLGGGTFNVTVFRFDAKNRVEIKATGGDDQLGGEDFNDLIIEFCLKEFKEIHGVNLAEGKTSDDAVVRKKTAKKLRQIRIACEVQKCYLSSASSTSVVVSLDNVYENFNLLVEVTRSEFEKLIHPLLLRSINIMDETLKKCGCKKENIDDVILIGGSSRIPKVQQMVKEYFAGKRIRRTIDADQKVACGAAVHAYNVFKENGAPFSAVTLLDEIRWGNKINGFPPRSRHAAVAVGNSIYSFGGWDWGCDNSSYSEDVLDVFVLNVNEREKKWEKLSIKNREVKPYQRVGHSAVAHKEFVLIFGGWDVNEDKSSNSTYRLNTETLKWDKPKVTGKIPRARSYHSAVVLRNEMLIYGGREGEKPNDLHSLDLESFCWSIIETTGISPSLRRGYSMTVHNDRLVLVFGGYDYDNKKEVNTIESFDINNKTWTSVETRGTLPRSRRNPCAFVHNGRMYIFGGSDYFSYFNDVFSYDLETFEWKEVTPNGEAPSPRCDAGCVALNDQVFIFGGYNFESEDIGDTHVLQM